MNKDKNLDQLLQKTRTKSRLRWVFIVLAVLVLAAGSLLAMQYWPKPEHEQGPRYNFVPISKGDLVSSISATGTVEAINTVEVGAEISGRILSLNADFNDAVAAGQLLAEIDPEQHKAQLNQAKAQLLAADAQVTEAQATLVESNLAVKRAAELAAKGLISAKELESTTAKATRAKASLKSAKASAALARASLDSARSKLSKTEIVSPINGMVLSREVEVGQTINAGMQTPVLFKIAEDLRRMRLSSNVDEADIGKVGQGQAATFSVDAYPAKEFHSTVTSVRNVPNTDQSVVSYEVLLSVDNQQLLLKPGMTASVEITTEKLTDVLLIDNKALRFSPASNSNGMRGPRMPFFGSPGRGKGAKGEKKDPTKAMGKVSENQGVLWVQDGGGPNAALRPVKVIRLATDGIKTAIKTKALNEGDEVVLEQLAGETP